MAGDLGAGAAAAFLGVAAFLAGDLGVAAFLAGNLGTTAFLAGAALGLAGDFLGLATAVAAAFLGVAAFAGLLSLRPVVPCDRLLRALSVTRRARRAKQGRYS